MEYSFDINSEQENRDSIKMRISVFHLVILFLIIIIAFVDYFIKLVGVVAHNAVCAD